MKINMKTARIRFGSPESAAAAFSRVDLWAILFALGILAMALLPAFARVHINTQTDQCLYNLRQLTAGWWMYANDNEGNLAPNRGLFPANPDYSSYPRWVAGDMSGGSVGAPYTGIDATNTALLVNPAFSQMGAYVKNPALYHCPADLSTWGTGGVGVNEMPRVRSYSMSQAVGPESNGSLVDSGHVAGHWLSTGNAGSPGGTPWRVYIKASDLVAPAPSALWVLIEEHPNSINDGAFAVEMPTSPSQTTWIDLPAKYHQNGANLSFADGHVEYHQWLDSQYLPSVIWAVDTTPNIGIGGSVPKDADVIWLAHRTTALAAGALGGYQP